MIFQDPMTSLNPLRTIGYHITEVIKRFSNLNNKETSNRAISILKAVGFPNPKERLNQYPHEFSGGMRQRVMIAMAISSNPKIIIADEPTTALDVTIQAQILDVLINLKKENKNSLILITHDLGVVAQRCQRVYVMYGGKVMEYGKTDEIFYDSKHFAQ